MKFVDFPSIFHSVMRRDIVMSTHKQMSLKYYDDNIIYLLSLFSVSFFISLIIIIYRPRAVLATYCKSIYLLKFIFSILLHSKKFSTYLSFRLFNFFFHWFPYIRRNTGCQMVRIGRRLQRTCYRSARYVLAILGINQNRFNLMIPNAPQTGH